jgi:non-lysosomal glucosylceramidase
MEVSAIAELEAGLDPTRRESGPETLSAGCCCGAPLHLDRRDFLKMVGAGGVAALALPVMAGPFENPSFDVNIPADKMLSPDWVKSLFARGTPEVYRGEALHTIGMPIGGICAGHVELSGDGMLKNWWLDGRTFSLQQGFALRTVTGGRTDVRLLNQHDFPGVTFRGEYPIARLEYADPAAPIQTRLEVFSPFIPLHAEDSCLPATVFHFTLQNTSNAPVEATLAGGLQNGVCLYRRLALPGTRRNRVTRAPNLSVLSCTAEPGPAEPASARPDVVFEDWTREDFAGWTVAGTAFGSKPLDRKAAEKAFSNPGGPAVGVVTSDVPGRTGSSTGTLTSAPFAISRRYVNVWLGASDLPGQTCVNLLVDGQPVQSRAGLGQRRLSPVFFDVSAYEGRRATLQIVDSATTPQSFIGVGRIFFSDFPGENVPMERLADFGSMALSLLGPPAELALAKGSIGFDGTPTDDASVPLSGMLTGTLGRTVHLQPGESTEIVFLVSWHFPNLTLDKLGDVGRLYTKRFNSATWVAEYVALNFERLAEGTRLWRDTWYDSTLPFWFLDRTLINASTLATSGCYLFANGRFYAWEGGASCCPGTCTHVWQYAHSVARLFPELERDTRERVDLGIARNPASGVIGFRAEFDSKLAVDGQAGTILRIYREHQMSADSAFLQRNWDKIKQVYQPLFALDADADGILEGAQMNTLDQPWYGQISWMSSMYVAALRAGERMAMEMGDAAFAGRCRQIAENGTKNISARLFNGEYFFNIVDPARLDTVNSGDGCHIDQVYGQSWAFQVGLPRVLPEKETRSALRSLWKYNFSPDAGAYFTAHKQGRKGFVNAGDAGLIMCTFPRPDWDYQKACGGNSSHGFAYYLNETWTGNEYQVAGHMLWEGMALEGLAIVRAIHDRYNAIKRNPWSEVECGSHYSRAMASHGAFIAACGYEYHGPRGHIGFAPALTPENFRAPFTAAEGWGTYAQTIAAGKLQASLEIKTGRLRLRTVSLRLDGAAAQPGAKASLNGVPLAVSCARADGRWQLTFPTDVLIAARQKLALEIA